MDKNIVDIDKSSKILVHACCAPCSAAILEKLVKEKFDVTVFYSNSNIYPEAEFMIRENECCRYAKKLNVKIITDLYNHEQWREYVRGLEKEKERGLRCLACFRYRLFRAAEYAYNNGYDILTTSLASSRWKDLNQVNEAGEYACRAFPDLKWWGNNWRKGGLQERRNELLKTEKFYNQLYCGCEFSKPPLQ